MIIITTMITTTTIMMMIIIIMIVMIRNDDDDDDDDDDSSRKCISKSCLQNGGHFVAVSVYHCRVHICNITSRHTHSVIPAQGEAKKNIARCLMYICTKKDPRINSYNKSNAPLIYYKSASVNTTGYCSHKKSKLYSKYNTMTYQRVYSNSLFVKSGGLHCQDFR